VLQRPRLVLGEDDDLASPFSKALEQFPRLSFPWYNAVFWSKVRPS
jgi:hypothetical protein